MLAVGAFSIYHFYLLCCNTTTIESSEKERAATMRRRDQIRHVRFPYDLGVRLNLCAVLGSKPSLWCWPQQTPGSGLDYPVSAELGEWIHMDQRGEQPAVTAPSINTNAFSSAERVQAAGKFV